ncbi:6-bladed beta-propeller protein [Roseivirga pacifica]|uniref:6-bladed beta-propeller protein n=1 Tax=Roseivirga pacifica TaxID=1267423 RepID=A0A1I0MS12_9BACT|nr:6-bladed beta-propeller [Roseivirga pacifica]RKQ50626.1 6-bladed beta-propeller protein [Roseivirga pacifica]SEV91026.1 6-bladed beta-propeller protein [Roseivirga pacifica]
MRSATRNVVISLSIITILFINQACQFAQENTKNTASENYKIENDLIDNPTPLDMVVEQVHILYLNSNGLLSGPLSALEYNGLHYVADLGAPNVYIYNKEGKKIGDFKSLNSGENEGTFFFISQFWRHNEELYLYDATSASIYIFDIKGLFKKKIRVKITNATSVIGDDGNYYFDMNRMPPFGLKNSLHNIEVFNNQMEHVKSLDPFKYQLPFNTGAGLSNFNKLDDQLFYHQPHSETIYRISKRDLKPAFNIDFGESWLLRDETLLDGLSQNEFLKLTNNPEKVASFNSWVSTDYLLLQPLKKGHINHILIDRNDGLIQGFIFGTDSVPFTVLEWVNNRLLVSANPKQLKQILSTLRGSNIPFNESGESLTGSFGLIWIEFK